jgi:flagellin-like hook-associated protein FlgL
MSKRLLGLLLIIRALTPVLIVLVVAVLGSVILNDLQDVLKQPVQTINTQLNTLQTTLDGAKQDFQNVSSHVTTVVNAISSVRLPDLHINIPTNISIPPITIPSASVPVPTASVSTSTYSFGSISAFGQTVSLGSITYPSGISIGTTNKTLSFPSVPGFNVPLPGLDTVKSAVNGALNDVKNQLDAVSGTFNSIGALSIKLQSINNSVSSIVVETQNAMISVGGLASKWASALLVAMIVILVLVVIYTFTGIIEDFTRGWNLLLGRA